MIRWLACMTLICTLWAAPLWAVNPNEVLDNPVLEQRARLISKGLRCLQCRNESIDESNADIAKDLRLLVRERLLQGDSDTEVVDYVVARYGEYVLLSPTTTGINLVLWLAGPMLFLCVAGGLLWVSRRKPSDITPLTDAEESQLNKLLNDKE